MQPKILRIKTFLTNTLLILSCVAIATLCVCIIQFTVYIVKASTPQEATGPGYVPNKIISTQKGPLIMADFNTKKITNEDMPELVGQLIDIFEDFLEEKGISIENPEKQEAIADGEDPDSICILYGTDYGELQSQIEETLINWNLAEPWQPPDNNK